MQSVIDVANLHGRKLPPDEISPQRGAGVYAYYLRDCANLPGVTPGSEGLIYVGMTEQGLDAREHTQHKHSGFSTFRRSLGALLKDQLELAALPRSAGKSKSNLLCFRFDEQGEKALSLWMSENLLCAQTAIASGVAEQEADLISALEPPLNLKGWRNPQAAFVKAQRAECVREAERAGATRTSL